MRASRIQRTHRSGGHDGDRVADRWRAFGGSWTFIITFGVLMTIYTAIISYLGVKAWDAYPFILLNLFLSMLAALQRRIMMSQNRQDTKTACARARLRRQ